MKSKRAVWRVIFLAGFIFVMGVTGVTGTGCSNPVRIQGKITHIGSGEPIPGAFVAEEDSDTFFTADSLGYYVIPEARSARHFIIFGAENFEPEKVEFKAEGEDSVYILDVALEPEPFEVMY